MDADRFGLARRACGSLGAVSGPELFRADILAGPETLGGLLDAGSGGAAARRRLEVRGLDPHEPASVPP